jgi:hypothetical protein
VIRAGFGIYSGAAQNDDQNAALESDNQRLQLSSGAGGTPPQLQFGPGYLQNPPDFGTAPAPLLAPRALYRHRRDLYVETWGLTIQRELPAEILLTASYLGSHGVRLFARNYENLCDQTLYQTSGGVDVLDPVSTNFLNTSCEKATFGWPCDADIERLRDALAKETDPTKQKAIAEAVSLRASEYVTHVPLGQYLQPSAFRKSITGVVVATNVIFWNIEKK